MWLSLTSWAFVFLLGQGMIALRHGATELTHEDYMEGILEVQAKKKANLQYYAWYLKLDMKAWVEEAEIKTAGTELFYFT